MEKSKKDLTEKKEQSKKQWNQPELTNHGDVEKITKGVTGTSQTDRTSIIP